jgi:hypothetical protein
MGSLSMVKGKVVLLPFPFNDFSSLKVRPAVCLTDPVGQHRQVVVAFITSKVPADLFRYRFADPYRSSRFCRHRIAGHLNDQIAPLDNG